MAQAYGQLPSFLNAIVPNVFKNMPFPCMCLAGDMQIVYLNLALAEFLKLPTGVTPHVSDFISELLSSSRNEAVQLSGVLQKAMEYDSYECICKINNYEKTLSPAQIVFNAVTYAGEKFFVCYVKPMDDFSQEAKLSCPNTELTAALLDTMPLVIHIWSKDCTLIDCSSAVLDIFKVQNKEDYIANFSKFSPLYQPDGLSSDLMKQYLQEAFDKGKCTFQWINLDNTGRSFPSDETLCRTILNGEERVIGYTHDISAVTENILNITTMEERTRAILDVTPMAINIWDKNLKMRDCNLESLKIFGYEDKEEFLEEYDSTFPEFQPDGKKTMELAQKGMRAAFKHGYYHFDKFYGKTKTGEPLPFEITYIRLVLRDEEMIIAYLRDLREITQILDTLKANEERIQTILDDSPMAIHIWDCEGNMCDCNLETLRLFGFDTKEEFLKNHFLTLTDKQPNGESSKFVVLKGIETAYDTGYCHYDNFWGRTKSGEELPLEITFISRAFQDKDMVIVYLRDLREITRVLDELKENEARVQTMLDITPLGINVWSKEQELLDCNESIVKLFGFESKRDYFDSRELIILPTQPDGTYTHDLGERCLYKAFIEGQTVEEFVFLNKQGDEVPVEITFKKTRLHGEERVISYIRDLRELKAMLAGLQAIEEDLRAARDAAEQSARAKSEFLANMSHEIRTPLNGVLGLLHLLAKTDLSTSQQGYVDKTIFSAGNLLRIINDILDFSKIDAGKMEMEHIPFTLREISSEIKVLFEPQASAKNLQLEFLKNDLSSKIMLGDPLRIKQIFFNLVGNAIKFTDQGSIVISMEGVDEGSKMRCSFFVKDSGIGMSQTQCTRLFSAFMQADTSFTRKYGGTGLGLVIARRIARLMNGDLWVESVEGEGSTFFFTAEFEFASDADDITRIAIENTEFNYPDKIQDEASGDYGDEIIFDESFVNDEDKICQKSTSQSGMIQENSCHEKSELPSNDCSARKAHILLVEDNNINQLIAEELLQSAGHTVDIAHNGQEALDMLRKNLTEKIKYNLVFMDIQMPVMDGLTAVTKIREDAQLKDLPVVAMSAHAMTGDKEISLEHGMNEHITKPISPEILFATVKAYAKFED